MKIIGLASLFALKKRQYPERTLAQLAYQQKGWYLPQLKESMAEELARHSSGWGEKTLEKPIREAEVKAGVEDAAAGFVELANLADTAEDRKGCVDILSSAVKLHHFPTFVHQVEVAVIASDIANYLNIGKVGDLLRAASLHDVGKIAVPAGRLGNALRVRYEEGQKEGKLHVYFGYHLLNAIPYLSDAAKLLGYDHFYDGVLPKELPRQIPLEAQIISAADYFHALTDPLRYSSSEPLSRQAAAEKIMERDYDPKIKAAISAIV